MHRKKSRKKRIFYTRGRRGGDRVLCVLGRLFLDLYILFHSENFLKYTHDRNNSDLRRTDAITSGNQKT